jgi:glycerophosphoryl diester phosphodiesterase
MAIPLLVVVSATPAPAVPPPPLPLVVGHRGARARFPENTLPALRHALEAGAGGVEVDVRVSADDVPVLMHDATLPPDLCRTPDGRRVPSGTAVRSLPLGALRRFDCGAAANPRFPAQVAVPGTPIPTLEEALDLLEAPEPPGARRATLFLELKHEEGRPAHSPPRDLYARLVVDVLRRRGALGRTLVLSFDHALLRAVHGLEPSLGTVALVDRAEDLVALAHREGVSWVGPRHTRVTAGSVADLHAAGVKVFAWTANSPRDQDRLAALGVDAVGTDDPALLAARWAGKGAR